MTNTILPIIIISFIFGKFLQFFANFMPFFYEVTMQARFNIDRERQNQIFYKEYMNDKCSFQFHSQIELYFVNDGEMDFTVNNHRRMLKKGEMSVSLSYDTHAYSTPEHSESSVFIIPVHMCEAFISATKNKKPKNPFICDADTVEHIKSLVEQIRRPDINEIEQKGYIYVILGILADRLFLTDSDTETDPTLSSRILRYIHENLNEDISLETLAAEFGYNKSYISRYFKSRFKIGFNKYLNTARLKNALMLLHEGKHSITECALESGFSSIRTFYRVFSSEFSSSPTDYIKNSRNSETI